MWAQQHGVHSPQPMGLQSGRVPSRPATETNTDPLMWQRSLGRSASGDLWQVDYVDSLSLWKGQCFVLTGIDAYSGYGFAFSACNGSAKTTIDGLTESLHTALLLIKELTSQQRSTAMGPSL